jgi:heme O synthase-like polyprenyltransferase
MDKTRYNRIVNALFIVIVGLTFFNLYNNIIWLSCVLAAIFLIFVALHIRDYKNEKPKVRKIFIVTLIILLNFLLANAVIIIAEFVYPY